MAKRTSIPAKKTAPARKKAVTKKAATKKTTAKKKAPEKRKALTKKYRTALKKKNLEAFEKLYPTTHAHLLKFTPMSTLVIGDDGEPDTLFNDQYFYNHKHKSYCEDQLRGYKRDPNRFSLATLNPEAFDEYAGRFLHNTLLRATEEGMIFSSKTSTKESYFIFCFGIGLAGFIDDLVKYTNCHCLVLFDQSYEFLYHSLEVYDWAALFARFKKRDGKVMIYIGNDPDTISTQTRAVVRSVNACSLDGMYAYSHYNHTLFARASTILMEDKNLIVSGLGFLDDEIIMIKHAHANLYAGKAKIYLRPPDRVLPLPAFVIGSGPSLDRDIAHIKKLTDKAIIISCGSAIRPLMVNGIVPDFHVELENDDILPLISQVHEKFDMSSICLLTSITGDRSVLKFFKKVSFYFRGSLSPFPIFFRQTEEVLLYCNPTVANAGLSFAQEIGCREIFMFGTDMGSLNPDIHHSKDSYHYTEGAVFLDQVYTIPVPGNFGGTCYTSEGLYWAKDSLETAIKGTPRGRVYYNCANGAMIEGTIARTAKSIDLKAPEKEKEITIGEIIDSFPVYTKETFEELWQDDQVVASMHEFIDLIRNIFKKHKNFSNKRYLTNMVKLLEGSYGRLRTGNMLLFRGSIYMAVMCFEYYLNRLSKPSDRKKYQEIAREEMLKMLDILLDKAIEKIGNLSAKEKARRSRKTSKKKVLAKKPTGKKPLAKKTVKKKTSRKKSSK
ncbi:MAG: motility associated factor glycosyltransferase family protein [Rhodospirillales bacterium]|nr:motility associated factor glycosyltransferase family protein [Rhodospirillales bacterium]